MHARRWLWLAFVAASLATLRPAAALTVKATASFRNCSASATTDIDEPTKPGSDTLWIADWSFDSGGGCTSAGWTHADNRILNDGSNYWHIGSPFNGTNGIVNNAAILSAHNLCWGVPDGYGNNWDYAIICKYREPGATISFNFVSDSEPGFDYFMVEADSAGASEARVDYIIDPSASDASVYRNNLLTFSGVSSIDVVTSLALPDYGVAGTNEVYLHFTSDGGYSDEDGYYPSNWGAGAVVDNIVITGTLAYSENFEGALNANITLVNSANSNPFGTWARLYPHITDNDRCVENTTCAWLWSDPLRLAFFPDMSFGPGGAVMHNWLDDIIISPWVSLASTPSATGTVLSYRTFPGNRFASGRIVDQWQVRARVRVDNTDTSAPGDSVDCTTAWQSTSGYTALDVFTWKTESEDLSSSFDPRAHDVQVAFRVADWQRVAGDTAPATLDPGPGPYLDRVRIGRRVLAGPVFRVGIDTRTQAQDCFPTAQNAISPGRHYSPTTDLFGTCAWSAGADLGINGTSPNLITGDSIVVDAVVDARGTGGITGVTVQAAITAGAHAGKAPAPYTVGANGFFTVQADSAKDGAGMWIDGRWFVSLDDDYFRGGDTVKYFWYATDGAGAGTSSPAGITAGSFPPVSVAAAEASTGGLYEVNYLPTIAWSASYLARIAADPNGKLTPTPAELAASEQKNCILYYQHMSPNRRSSTLHRTSFMFTLDRLGYAGHYDVYDVQGYGNTNNQLAGRATVAQCSGYALIVEDDGRSNHVPNIPDGTSLDNQKINQGQWYRDYLNQGVTGLAGVASLWIIGESTAFEGQITPLFSTTLGLASVVNDQALSINPNVAGMSSFTFQNGCSGAFTGDVFSLNGGCPVRRDYDAAAATGTAAVTHRYKSGSTVGGGAIIMNKNTALRWNTVWMGFGWFDIRDAAGGPPAQRPEETLAQKILSCVLPVNCQHGPNPVGTEPPGSAALPAVSVLYQNVPNPFNPTTTIGFDLARAGRVTLRIYDVAGHQVRTLIDGERAAGFGQKMLWDGFDDTGQRVASGVYHYQLATPDGTFVRKLVVLR